MPPNASQEGLGGERGITLLRRQDAARNPGRSLVTSLRQPLDNEDSHHERFAMRNRLRTLLIVLALLPVYVGLVGAVIGLANAVTEARRRAKNSTCNNHLRQWTGAIPANSASLPTTSILPPPK